MRNSKWLVVGFLVCLFSSSVSAASKSISDTEIRSVAEPILDRILMAYKTNDYQLYSKDFDVALKNYLTKEIFLKYDADLEGSIGHCQNRQYLGFLRQNEKTIILWKAEFDKTTYDVLIKLEIVKKDERYEVTRLWFE